MLDGFDAADPGRLGGVALLGIDHGSEGGLDIDNPLTLLILICQNCDKPLQSRLRHFPEGGVFRSQPVELGFEPPNFLLDDNDGGSSSDEEKNGL